ncbi:MAG: gfo/Idh/MocA family oxidoreductase, partial [Akkermansiaceae bacterium]
LFNIDGLDETSFDTCELYTQENGNPVDRKVTLMPCEDMGRIRSASNFVLAIDGKEPPLNTPDQALKLMKIIDAVFLSAETGKPVSL